MNARKSLVSIVPHRLGHSLARALWNELPRKRQVDLHEADVVLYDEANEAVKGFAEDPSILRIVVVHFDTTVPKLPKGVFWVKSDPRAFLNLVRNLNPGG